MRGSGCRLLCGVGTVKTLGTLGDGLNAVCITKCPAALETDGVNKKWPPQAHVLNVWLQLVVRFWEVLKTSGGGVYIQKLGRWGVPLKVMWCPSPPVSLILVHHEVNSFLVQCSCRHDVLPKCIEPRDHGLNL
jgi:hypothetical protein